MKDKVITFFGGDAKTGTTMLSESMAEALAKEKKRVLLIKASCEKNDSFIPKSEGLGIDYIAKFKPSEQDIKKITQRYKGYDYIKGNDSIALVKLFNEYTVSEIVELVGKDYDCIIVDGGHNFHFPLPVSALIAGDRRYYVVEPTNRSMERTLDMLGSIAKHLSVKEGRYSFGTDEDDKIILNKFTDKGILNVDTVRAYLGKEVLTVPLVSNGPVAEINEKTFYASGNKGFVSAIGEIMKDLED